MSILDAQQPLRQRKNRINSEGLCNASLVLIHFYTLQSKLTGEEGGTVQKKAVQTTGKVAVTVFMGLTLYTTITGEYYTPLLEKWKKGVKAKKKVFTASIMHVSHVYSCCF